MTLLVFRLLKDWIQRLEAFVLREITISLEVRTQKSHTTPKSHCPTLAKAKGVKELNEAIKANVIKRK